LYFLKEPYVYFRCMAAYFGVTTPVISEQTVPLKEMLQI